MKESEFEFRLNESDEYRYDVYSLKNKEVIGTIKYEFYDDEWTFVSDWINLDELKEIVAFMESLEQQKEQE